MDARRNFAMTASPADKRATFDKVFDTLLDTINFTSEKEAVLPENIEKTKEAFLKFFDDMVAIDPMWNMPLWSFEELLKEKSGEFYYRADGRVPNWYHEMRNFLIVGSAYREGLIEDIEYSKWGGFAVTAAIIMRHDSWEDLGKEPITIYAALERNIHKFMDEYDTYKDEPNIGDIGYQMRQESVRTTDTINLLTRKFPVVNESGGYDKKPNGKLVKTPRFGGNLHVYFDGAAKTPHFGLVKWPDSVEGMATRLGAFTATEDQQYLDERMHYFWERDLDKEAINAFPFMKNAIEAFDGLLGILIRHNKNMLWYMKDDNNPAHARSLDVEKYMPQSAFANRLGPAWNPVSIMLEREEDAARVETDGRRRMILDQSDYPALAQYFPMPHNYSPTTLPPRKEYGPFLA